MKAASEDETMIEEEDESVLEEGWIDQDLTARVRARYETKR